MRTRLTRDLPGNCRDNAASRLEIRPRQGGPVAPTATRSPFTREGFTLVELIVALLLLSIGLLGLAGSATVVTRLMGAGSQLTIAAAVAESRIEALAAEPCVSTTGGPVTTRGITESWTVSGTGQTRTVRDSLSYVVARGGPRFMLHEGAIQCR